MPLQWTQDLATGLRDIDEQHRDLFANVAALRDSMRLGSAAGATRTISFLERYTIDHFSTEERWMERTCYPELEKHRAAHRALLAEFVQRKTVFARTGATASNVLDLSDWLGNWLFQHVNGADRAMAVYLRDKVPAHVSRAET